MSHSYKHSPFVPIVTTDTAKPAKARIHRQERNAVRQMLRIDPYVDVPPESKEFGDARLDAKEFYCYVPNWSWPELARRLRK